jgi:nitroreductase
MHISCADELLTTTRSVRKRLDLTRDVPAALIEECIEIAIQAPTGSNAQGWHFVVVTDAEKRAGLARLYKQAFEVYANTDPLGRWAAGDMRAEQAPRVRESAVFLAENLGRVPVHVIPCIEGRVETAPAWAQASIYGSILPAAWSFMLAARARGLGAAWTSLHLLHETEASELLGIPAHVTQTALLPVAWYTGEGFGRAKRIAARELTHWNTWGRRREGA